jgi:2-oxoglutarate ferredoxin oxidoreductase subunit beta
MTIAHPIDSLLRQERMPHIWCPGCGIGTSVNCFGRALLSSGLDLSQVSIVSGIGCTGRVAGYMRLDSFHTTHGRAIPFATGLKLGNPKLKVIVYSGDGDLIAIGGNHFMHAARRNMDLMVVCVNNFNYAMTGGQVAPTTPLTALGTTAPYGNYEQPFNLPMLAESCGATYVARWTVFHVRQLEKTFAEALTRKGFVFIEVLGPCPTLYGRRNRLGDAVDMVRYYKEKSTVKNNANTREVGIGFQGDLIIGKFVDSPRPTFEDLMHEQLHAKLGDKYIPSAECGCGE